MTYLYRVEMVKTAPPLNEFDELVGRGDVHVRLLQFPVMKWTPCGAWIDTEFGRPKFVNLYARKKYACYTIEAAYRSFRRRKEVQRNIYQARIHAIDKSLDREARKEVSHG